MIGSISLEYIDGNN